MAATYVHAGPAAVLPLGRSASLMFGFRHRDARHLDRGDVRHFRLSLLTSCGQRTCIRLKPFPIHTESRVNYIHRAALHLYCAVFYCSIPTIGTPTSMVFCTQTNHDSSNGDQSYQRKTAPPLWALVSHGCCFCSSCTLRQCRCHTQRRPPQSPTLLPGQVRGR